MNPDYDHTDIGWTFRPDRYRLTERDGVVYRLLWAPDTLADDIVCALAPFPSTTAPGLTIEGNTADRLAHEAEEAKETAAAVASDTFKSLPLVEVSSNEYAKRPRSEKEIVNLLAAQGETHIVQLLGRSSTNEVVLKHAGVRLSDAWWDEEAGRRRDFPSLWLDQWCIDSAYALSRLHAKGILHHDLNPNNVLHVADRATICDLEAGPFTYRSPEIFMDSDKGKFDKRGDMFLFGLLLWSIENRNMPRKEAWKVLSREGTFGPVMDKCLQVDPSKRPTVEEAYQEMKHLFTVQHCKPPPSPL